MDKYNLLLALNTLLDNSPDLIFIKDENLIYKGASKVFTDMVGLEKSTDIIGKTDYDIFDEQLAKKYVSDDKEVLVSEKSLLDCIEPLPTQNGLKRYSSTSKYIIRDENGKIGGLIGVGRDVTADMELRAAHELREISNKMFNDILEADITNNKMISNNYSTFSQKLVLIEKMSFSEASVFFAETFINKEYQKEFIEKYNVDRLIEDYSTGLEEFTHVTYMLENEVYKWYEFSSRLYYSTLTDSLRIITFLRDVDKKINDSEELKLKAETDSLTGLWNRRVISEKIKEYISSENSNGGCALLFVDVDHFKALNDSRGHLFGDTTLRALGIVLVESFGNDAYVGRLGGDEFIVLIKGTRNRTVIENKVNKFFEKVIDIRLNSGNDKLTCSVGIAVYDNTNKTFDQLYNEADKAMYKAKENGRSRWMFYGDE